MSSLQYYCIKLWHLSNEHTWISIRVDLKFVRIKFCDSVNFLYVFLYLSTDFGLRTLINNRVISGSVLRKLSQC